MKAEIRHWSDTSVPHSVVTRAGLTQGKLQAEDD